MTAHGDIGVNQRLLNEIDRWKAERTYPFENEPQTPVEAAERQVFDIVALTVSRHLPDFSDQSAKSRALQMRILRQAIESGPDELQSILTQVLDLPKRTQNEFARLLKEADLANVISASRLVADRLKFLSGIEHLLYDPETCGLLKERSQPASPHHRRGKHLDFRRGIRPVSRRQGANRGSAQASRHDRQGHDNRQASQAH